MKELREKMMAKPFCRQVSTYIQSGNVVLQSSLTEADEVAESVEKLIELEFGFRPRALPVSVDDFRTAAQANPYKEAEGAPKSLHLYFLSEQPKEPNLERLQNKRSDTESFTLRQKVFYLHAPDGVGRSKLAADVEKALGVAATARNWNSVAKLLEMSSE